MQASELVEFASDAALVIDVDARIVAWNDLAQKMLGYSPSEAIGLHCGDILQATLPCGEPLCNDDCDLIRCFQECRPYGVPNCHLRHRDGQWITANITTVAMSERARSLNANKVMAVIFIREGVTIAPVQQHHTLQVFTLGGFGMVVAGRSVDIGKWKRKQALTLLKYLVARLDRPVHRERLLNLLWPDVAENLARGRLKVTLYCLRRELRNIGLRDEVVKTVGDAYLLRRDAVWTDTNVFEQSVSEGRMLQKRNEWSNALDHYEKARHLYRGDYLEEDTFADWCAEERERLHELYLELLAGTAECHAELGQYTRAVHICRKALVFDPCRESFHYALMKYLVISGYPELALAQYHSCERVLAREFDTAPLSKTQYLYQQILKKSISIPASMQGRN